MVHSRLLPCKRCGVSAATVATQSPYDALARVRVERATSEAPSSGVGTG